MFFTIYASLCKQIGKSPTGVALELGISRSNVNYWRNGKQPNASVLNQLADYFDVSVDYLLGKTDDPNKEKKPSFISDETWDKMKNDPSALKLLEMILKMSPEQRDKFENFLGEM